MRHAADLDPVNARLAERGADIPVIAKIEKREAAEDAEEIVQAATGGIMVARGDLGIELPIEKIPLVQKRLLRLAGRYSKPSITATQMLASMVRSTRPTRAEATDVANAIFDGTDALMLSEETAVGQHPVEGGADDGADRRGDRARAALRRLARAPHARDVGDVADTVSYGAVGGRLPARPRGAGGADAQRAHGAARVGAPAAACPCSRSSPRPETVAAAEPALRRRARPQRGADTLDELLEELRRAREGARASPSRAT